MYEEIKMLLEQKGKKIVSGGRMRIPLNESKFFYWVENGDVVLEAEEANQRTPSETSLPPITIEAQECFWGLRQASLQSENQQIKTTASLQLKTSSEGNGKAPLSINASPIIIGSGQEVDFTLKDTAVSRKHAELVLTTEGVKVRDLGSTNGVYHKGEKFSELTFSDNTTIHIGTSELAIVFEQTGRTMPRTELTLNAVLMPETTVFQLPINALSAWLNVSKNNRDCFAKVLETWLAKWTHALPAAPFSNKTTTLLEPDQEIVLKEETTCQCSNFLWLRLDSGAMCYNADQQSLLLNHTWYPFGANDWLQNRDASQIKTINTEKYLLLEPNLHGVDEYHQLVISNLSALLVSRRAQQASFLKQQEKEDGKVVEDAFKELENAIKTRATTSYFRALTNNDDDLLPTVEKVAKATIGSSVKCKSTSPNFQKKDLSSRILDICSTNGFRTAAVELESGWWKNATSPLVGVRSETGEAVALLPNKNNSYDIWSPRSPKKRSLGKTEIEEIAPLAWQLFRPFPNKKLKITDVLLFGLKNLSREIRQLLFFSFLVGALGLAVPILTGILVDKIIPQGELSFITLLALALLLLGITTSVMNLINMHLSLRISTYMAHGIDSALWDKLLRMPLPFFRKYAVGDLLIRISSVTNSVNQLSDLAISVGLTSLSALLQGILLFFYSFNLAIATMGICLLFALLEIAVGFWTIKYQRAELELQGKINGFLTRLIKGISKIKSAGAQSRMFGIWASDYALYRQTLIRRQKIDLRTSFISGFTPTIATAVLFFGVIHFDQDLSAGEFIAFNTAFHGFIGGVMALTQILPTMLRLLPTIERIKPLLEAPVLEEHNLAEIGTISGKVEIDNLTFRYKQDSPYILKDINMEINPGEFIAFVGPSGSGKSTLLRLLLGLESCSSGNILYDGKDIAQVSLKSLRKQLGVVLQSGRLLPGSILQNISGSQKLNMEAAWMLAEQAALAQDIEAMPMGMHTNLTHGDALLSGGQKQRLLIARALSGKPKVLLLDEATSALDNESQARVMRNIEALRATRVVVAHRLSTIINADKIFVFNEGKIVQSGSYQELSNQEGLFRELVKNQS